MIKCLISFIIFLFATAQSGVCQPIYSISTGTIRFYSDAPQELIRASSSELKGVLDAKKKTFVLRIGIASFQGFNSPLQQEHFNENYMETSIYPFAIYAGKIIEDIDISKDGEYDVRTKGKLTIHGVEQESIIKSKIIAKDGRLVIKSDFTVSLSDFQIKIPRVVYDKLAPEINVSVHATLLPGQ